VLERAGKSSRLVNQLMARKDGESPHSAIQHRHGDSIRTGGCGRRAVVIECSEPVDEHIVPGTELGRSPQTGSWSACSTSTIRCTTVR
jgi:hypothetical protein